MAISHEQKDCEKSALESLICFSEKIAFWSAGIIAASVIFLWTVVSKNGIDINDNFWSVPLHWFLCIGWVFLIISFLLGLCTKRQCAIHVFCTTHKKNSKAEKKYCSDMCIINCLPAFFIIGTLLTFIFVMGAMKMVESKGKIDSSDRGFNHYFEKRMMMRDHMREHMADQCDKNDHREEAKDLQENKDIKEQKVRKEQRKK